MNTNYLNKLNALFNAMKEDEVMIKGVLLQLNNFSKYVRYVEDYVIKGEVLEKTNTSLEQVRDEKKVLDRKRNQQLDVAMFSLNAINRCCDAYQVERLADIDTEDRKAVTIFIGDFIKEIYMNEIKRENKKITKEEK